MSCQKRFDSIVEGQNNFQKVERVISRGKVKLDNPIRGKSKVVLVAYGVLASKKRSSWFAEEIWDLQII